MKINNKITASLITTGFVLVFNVNYGHFNQTDTIRENPYIHWTYLKGNSLQEKSRYQYVGAEKCASVCHNNETMGFQYNVWKSSCHSDAFKILLSKKAGKYAKKAHVKGNPQECSACLKCHVTGGEPDSSYFSATYKKEEGVTCEACHKQKSDGITYLPDESDCLKCHNDSIHKMNRFNFREKCAKIAHPRPKE